MHLPLTAMRKVTFNSVNGSCRLWGQRKSEAPWT